MTAVLNVLGFLIVILIQILQRSSTTVNFEIGLIILRF